MRIASMCIDFDGQAGGAFGKPADKVNKTMRFDFDLVSRIFQTAVLGLIGLTLLLSPFVVYYFTTNFEAKLPMCTPDRQASDTWRCKEERAGAAVAVGGNPAYCRDEKQHLLSRGWCNANWDRPLESGK